MKANKTTNDINGLIVLDKPKGYTSNDCLSMIKKIIHPKKIGHTGTLDENATGVLVCLLGSATSSQEYLMKKGDKIYEAELILGLSTDTEDITGTVKNYKDDLVLNLQDVEKVVKSFIGEYNQVPPMYSAKKVGGKKLVNLARAGKEIDRKASKVNIYDIELLSMEDYNLSDYRLKKVNMTVRCSKGTYIRTLCKDIGEKLNLPSCMGNLRRVATSGFNIDESITVDQVKQKFENNDYSFIRPCFYQEYDTAITFGKFETLHIGHQKIIKEVVDVAKLKNYKSTVIIVGENIDTNVLTKEQRISKLKYLGVDNILYFPLDSINKKISPIDFVKEILYNELKAKTIVVGSDCRFGYEGKGDSILLKTLCDKLGIELKIIDKIKLDNSDEYVSSTLIKKEYENGNIELVNKLLGKNKKV